MSELKKIDINAKSFTANGKEYFIEGSLSYERLLMYQMLQIEVGYEVGFEDLFRSIRKIYEMCNKMQFADIAVLSNNLINGVKNIEQRRIPALQMCALFINTKDEDRRVVTDDLVQQKIDDWTKEGLDMLPFFQLAIGFIPGFSTVYKELFQTISEAKEDMKNLDSLKKKK